MLNRKGDKGSPYLKPFSIGNSVVGEPFTRTDTLAVEIHCLIQPPLYLFFEAHTKHNFINILP
jgi:hypothetical protein